MEKTDIRLIVPTVNAAIAERNIFDLPGKFMRPEGRARNVGPNGRVALGAGFRTTFSPTVIQDRKGNDIPTFRAVPHAVWKAAKQVAVRSPAGRWYSGKKQAATPSGGARRRAALANESLAA